MDIWDDGKISKSTTLRNSFVNTSFGVVVYKVPRGHLLTKCLLFIVFLVMVLQVKEIISGHKRNRLFNLARCIRRWAFLSLWYSFLDFYIMYSWSYVCTLSIWIILLNTYVWIWLLEFIILLLISLLALHLFSCYMLMEIKYHAFIFIVFLGWNVS